jgi:glutathione reductase (NADPH)
MPYDYDLITIGAGSGGVAVSRRAAAHGAKVAIIEGSRVGGTCVLRGCVPKKLLMYAAQLGDALHDARGYGWQLGQAEEPRFQMQRWAASKASETTRLEGIYRQMLHSAGVALIEGWAQLDGPNTVRVNGQRISAAHIVLATGAAPVRDSIPGIEACATSDDLLDLTTLPPRAAIVGGGYIALEFASILARLGVQVSVFYRDSLPLRGFDAMLRSAIASELQAAGVALHPGSAPNHITKDSAGFVLHMLNGRGRGSGGSGQEHFSWVLNATGRKPSSAGLNLASVGVVTDRLGAVPVDEHLCTTAASVYALGDVTNRKNLTPVAIAEGRALADSLFGRTPRRVDLSLVASAVFTLPPLATVGPSEAELAQSGQRIEVFETDFRPMKQAFIGGQERTRMKLLVQADNQQVRAAHMIGADAPEIIQSLAVALSARATKADFDRTLAVHPTAAEEFVLMREAKRVLG